MPRLVFVAAVFIVMTPVLVALQRLLQALRLPGQFFISRHYYGLLCALLRLRVRVVGAQAGAKAVLVVADHVSWLGIPLLGAAAPAVFVAKREVADWPLIGFTAKAQRTIFVDRTARARTAAANREIAARIVEGHPFVLFAEGTSSDGNRVLRFRSGLLGAAGEALAQLQPA
jgi:1-acyl-sn-glycerol-3-phosphate acyltransferase